MTKKDGNKRKIIIEDKRGKEDPQSASDRLGKSGQDLLSQMQADAGEAFSAVDDALAGFGDTARETAGRAAAAEDAGKQGRESEPEPVPEPKQDQPPTPEEEPAAPEDLAERLLELAQRKEAELQNFRKRAAKDKEDARRFAVEGLLFDLFPALDGLSQAAHTFKDTPPGENPLLDGVRSTIRSLEEALKKHGIEKISEAGVTFDPNLHQPLTVEEAEDAESEVVAEVYTEGFRYGDKILKPAMVKVIKPAAAPME
jgi:molecular chaperone GrpE